jgi:hypothetical protein
MTARLRQASDLLKTAIVAVILAAALGMLCLGAYAIVTGSPLTIRVQMG